MATTKEVRLSGCLSEESRMFRQQPQLKMMELTLWKTIEGETPSMGCKRWLFMDVRDPDSSSGVYKIWIRY